MTDRKQGIGGSDLAPLLGLDARKTPYQLWREKLGLDPEFAGSAATRRGNFLERAILDRYAREVQPASLVTGIEHVDEWRMAHLDARVVMPDGQCRVVEAKSVGAHAFREWGAPWSDEVPKRFLAQGSWYAAMDAAAVIDFAVAVVPDDPDEVMGLSPDEVMAMCRFHIFRALPSLDVEVWLMEKARAFWHDHVLAKVPPPPTTAEDVNLAWPHHIVGEVRPVMPVLPLLMRYDVLGETEKRAKRERESIREQLLCYAEGAEALVGPDGVTPLLTLKTESRKGYAVAASQSRTLRLTRWWERAKNGAPGSIQLPTPEQPQLETSNE